MTRDKLPIPLESKGLDLKLFAHLQRYQQRGDRDAGDVEDLISPDSYLGPDVVELNRINQDS